MPQLTKQALSQYIRSGCLRQLALNLYPDNGDYRTDRAALGMPYPQSPRPGLRQIQAAGDEWAEEKLHDLSQTFGAAALVGDPRLTPSNQTRFQPYRLEQAIPQAVPIRFLVECDFPVGPSFQAAMGIAHYATQYSLDYTRLRPDIIVVLPPLSYAEQITPDGTVLPLPPEDSRRQLRVVDIKLTAQASPGYFAEVALYSMVLAGWLIDRQLQGEFVVVPEGAVWPGSHEASTLLRFSNQARQQGLTPSVAELWQAMRDDLEPVPFEVFALRIRRFLAVDLQRALSQHWQALEWHVDNRCSFCEYLGENRGVNAAPPQAPHPDHCLPAALSLDHLSQVAFMSQGARLSLANHPTHPTATVADLARCLPADSVFDEHQALRATRTVVPERAAVLRGGQAHLAPQSGTSASMPRFANLHIYLSVDFDIGSAITVAFGMKGSWLEPRPRNANLATPRQNRRWPTVARIIDQRDLNAERRELLAFLREIHTALAWAQTQDQQQIRTLAVLPHDQADWKTKVQFYVWDSLQYEHLTRVVGRHLQAILQDQDINYLAWLFPPEELMPNPDTATCRSPITVVREVVRSHLAAPVAHYYSLVEVARVYHSQRTAQYIGQQRASNPTYVPFNIHPLFGTPLSDQIPSERAHEIWSRVTQPHWQGQLNTYQRTVGLRLDALGRVDGGDRYLIWG